jgi:MFS transporter, AAHS family, benzoate transport protein
MSSSHPRTTQDPPTRELSAALPSVTPTPRQRPPDYRPQQRGYLLGGRFADRGGVRRTTIGWFAGAAIFLAVFALPLPEPILYGALFLAGFFVFRSQALTYAYTQRVYPNHLRATGVGWTAGVGRLGAICGPLLGGSLIDRRLRLSVGVLCLCNRWCPRAAAACIVLRQTPQQHRATDDLPVAIDLTHTGGGAV